MEGLCPCRLEGGGGEISTALERNGLYLGFCVYVNRGGQMERRVHRAWMNLSRRLGRMLEVGEFESRVGII